MRTLLCIILAELVAILIVGGRIQADVLRESRANEARLRFLVMQNYELIREQDRVLRECLGLTLQEADQEAGL